MTPDPIGEPLLRLERASREFVAAGAVVPALRDASLSIHAGEFVAVTGPSGCGKSTLLALLGLLDRPTSGSLRLRGRRVDDLGPDERARLRREEVGFVFQAFHLIGDLSVAENVELPLTYLGVGVEERGERVRRALERVGLSRRAEHLPAQLSGGEQQRAALARALVTRPAVLLADEPTGNLDSANGAAVMALIEELHGEGSTVVLVTHDPELAGRAERRIHLMDGRIVDGERGGG